MHTSFSGEDLFGIVCDYAALGHHRSGTDRGLATVEWIKELVGDLGAVTAETVSFERYDVSSELTADGRPIDHLALYYEFTGDIDTFDVAIRRLDPQSGGYPGVADALIDETRRAGHEALVIATDHMEGDLVAINRDLAAPASGLPTVLVAGRHHDTLASSTVRLRLSARLTAGRTANVEVHNERPGRRLVLTTPLHGWFEAAGERGTGIAVLRYVAERLADRPLTIVATGGHELGYLGAFRWVERCVDRGVDQGVDQGVEPPACVVHLGASVAVESLAADGSRRLIGSRIGMTNLPAASARSVADALDGAGIGVRYDVDSWLGEGEAWSRLAVPVLSTTGAGPDFHTPSDTPERATSPDALATVAGSMARAAATFHDAVLGGAGLARPVLD